MIRKRPSISECLQHSWLSEDDEPPSPSPLMLKIPEPTFPPTRHHSDVGHRHGPPNSLGVPRFHASETQATVNYFLTKGKI